MNKPLDPAGTAVAHRHAPAVPLVEIAYDADATRAGGPDSEIYAADARDGVDVGAQFVVGVVVAAFAHEVEVELAEKKREGVGIVLIVSSGRELVLKAIAGWSGAFLLSFGQGGFKKTFGAELRSFDDGL